MKCRNCKVLILLGFLFILFSTFSSSVHAETTINQPANVYIDNIRLSPNLIAGTTTTGTFEIRNASNFSIPDVQYSISLTGDYVNLMPNTFYDTQFFGPVFLDAGEKKTVSFTYVVPKIAPDKGAGIQIQALLKSGTPMGWNDTFIHVQNGIAGVLIEKANLNVNGVEFITEGGPTVGNGKKGKLMITLHNPSKEEIVLTPQTEIFDRSETQEKLFSGNEPAITIAPGTSKIISIPLNTFNDTPKVYAGRAFFLDKQGVVRSPVVSYRYIVAGPIVTILKVRADKQQTTKGGEINLTIDLVGPPIDIITSVVPDVGMVSVKATLFGKDGTVIGEESIDIDIDTHTSPFVEVPVTAQESSDSFTAKIDIIKSGVVISTYSTSFTPVPEKKNVWYQSLITMKSLYITLAFFVFILLLLYVWKKNKRAGLVMFLILLVGASVMFLYNSEKKVFADFNNQEWTITGTTGTANSGNQNYFLEVSSVRVIPSLQNNDDYFVSGSAVMQGCNNHIPTLDFVVNGGPTIHRDGMSSGFVLGPYQRSGMPNPITLKVTATCGGGFGCSGSVEGKIDYTYTPPICPWHGESSTCTNYHPSKLKCKASKQVAGLGEYVTFTGTFDDAGFANNIEYYWDDYTAFYYGDSREWWVYHDNTKTFSRAFNYSGHKYVNVTAWYTLNNYGIFSQRDMCHIFVTGEGTDENSDITATPLPCSGGVKLDFSSDYDGKTINIRRLNGSLEEGDDNRPYASEHIETITVEHPYTYTDSTATPYVYSVWNYSSYTTHPGMYTYVFYDEGMPSNMSFYPSLGPTPTVTPNTVCLGEFASSCWEGPQGHPGSGDYYVGWNQTATWNSSVNGGTPPYTYRWTDDDLGDHSDSKSAVLRKYNTSGKKNMTLIVDDDEDKRATAQCYVTVDGPVNGQCGTSINQCLSGVLDKYHPADSSTVSRWSCLSTNGGTNANNCPFSCPAGKIVVNDMCVDSFVSSCSATPSSVEINGSVDWSATAFGGTPPYTYLWTIDNPSRLLENASNSYDTAGTKTMTLSMTDSAGGGSNSSCTVVVGSVTPTNGVCNNNEENQCLYGYPDKDSPADNNETTPPTLRWSCLSPDGGNHDTSCSYQCGDGQTIVGSNCTSPCTPTYGPVTQDHKVVTSLNGKCHLSWTATNLATGGSTVSCNAPVCYINNNIVTPPYIQKEIGLGTHNVTCTANGVTTTLISNVQCRLNPNFGEF